MAQWTEHAYRGRRTKGTTASRAIDLAGAADMPLTRKLGQDDVMLASEDLHILAVLQRRWRSVEHRVEFVSEGDDGQHIVT